VKSESTTPKTIDEYIAACAPAVQPILQRIRATVRKAVPEAEEAISYRMPTFKLKGVVLHFAAFKEHIGVYPPVRGDAELVKNVAQYAGEKGNLRFPLRERIPYNLIGEIAKVKARQNLAKAAALKAKRTRNR
jgi:uncharacterized protein YdhG (YjbR/CyaY superfamily)